MNSRNHSDTMCILKFKEYLWLFIIIILSISVTLATADSLEYESDDAIFFPEYEDENGDVPIGLKMLIDAIINDNRISDSRRTFNKEEEAEQPLQNFDRDKNSNEDIYRHYAWYKPDAVIYKDDNKVQPPREYNQDDSDDDNPYSNTNAALSVPFISGRNIITLPLICPPGQATDQNKHCRIIL